jgi:uroporphyrinogen decarboxylase
MLKHHLLIIFEKGINMTGKERVLKAINCQQTDRIPWVPFVGCHAAALLNKTATEYFKSAELISKGADAAIERYKPDGIPVTFDLQIEAEVLGCALNWADDNPPAVCSHPLVNGVDLEDLKIPADNQGRINIVLQACKEIRKNHPDIALYGLITGPFTLALHLLGTDIFMKMFDNTEYVHQLLRFCTDVAKAMSDYYIKAGCDIIAVVDPMTSQIGPEQFTEFITPYGKEIFDYIRQNNAKGSFFVCGHAQQNISVMCDCNPDNISIDENIPLDYVKERCLDKKISFGGNMQLTTVLLLGKEVDAQQNAVACMEIGGESGFILAPGCDLPYATPPANLEAVTKVVQDPYQRDIAKTLASTQSTEDKLDMREYGNADKVIVDIITLDSEACAPCQYMVDAVRKIAPEFEGIVEWREHKIKYKESLVFMTSLMVRNVPTICIDGEIKFVSRIPPKDELIAAVQKRINEKFRLKIKQKKATLYLLTRDSGGCKECTNIKDNVQRAIKELGVDVNFEQISDEKIMHSYGISLNQTPAIVMAKYQLKSVRLVPEVPVIKEWLKDLQ